MSKSQRSHQVSRTLCACEPTTPTFADHLLPAHHLLLSASLFPTHRKPLTPPRPLSPEVQPQPPPLRPTFISPATSPFSALSQRVMTAVPTSPSRSPGTQLDNLTPSTRLSKGGTKTAGVETRSRVVRIKDADRRGYDSITPSTWTVGGYRSHLLLTFLLVGNFSRGLGVEMVSALQ